MGFRRAAKVDANQSLIVAELRGIGCSVLIISQLKNCCDIVVGHAGRNYLFEIKDGNKPPSARIMSDGEKRFADGWRGQVTVILDTKSACQIMGVGYL